MALTTGEVGRLYRRRARRYDLTAHLYYLIGCREWAYRRQAVTALCLRPGDTVVEIGCGTGLNFGLLRRAIGPSGTVIGVDLTPAMLDVARQRIRRHGWSNVELVEGDAAAFRFPPGIAGVLSTFALTLVPEFDAVIRHGAEALAANGRWAVVDFKLPTGPARFLVRALLPLCRPFGVTLDLASRHPWESLRQHLGNVTVEERMLGYVYVAHATRTAP